ncbi:MAG: Rrf2 family transcriptional regulator, partial [Thalassobaculaceae bacterium]
RGGGMRLARSPADINLGAVFRFTERNLALVECFKPATSSCPLTDNCDLQNVFQEALRAFLAVLDRYSLRDLTENRHHLSTLLVGDDRPA